MSRQPNPHEFPERRASPRNRGRLLIAVVALVVLVLFVSQNTARVRVHFLFFNGDWPLWLLLLLTAVAGALVGQVVEYAWGRSKRRKAQVAGAERD